MDLMIKNRFGRKTISKNISRKIISNKLMILRSDKKKKCGKMSEKNQYLRHREGEMWKKVGTLLLDNDKNNKNLFCYFW